MRFRDPNIPSGDRVEIFIMPQTLPKIKKLLSIVGGHIVFQETEDGYIHMILEKDTSQKEQGNVSPFSDTRNTS